MVKVQCRLIIIHRSFSNFGEAGTPSESEDVEGTDDMSTLDDETHMSEQSKSPAPTNSSTAPPPSLTAPPQRKKAKVDAEAEVDKMLIKSLQEIQD